jgi:citrate lyase subunit beta / citryl-CoA lyase
MRHTRSWMFVPGNKERFLAKAATSAADVVLLDLEDGVLPAEKEHARALIGDTLAVADFAPPRYVRVNARETPWHADDLDAVVRPGLAGICLPKTRSPDDVLSLAADLDRLETTASLESRSIRILAAIEDAAALLAAPAIAQSDARVVGLIFGGEDYALDLGLGTARTGEAAEQLYARSSIVVAARAAGVLSVDGVFPDLDDPDGMLADVMQARGLGFTSKSTFNPRQVDEINRVFSPQPEEIAYARRVVDSFEDAQTRGDASVVVGGQLVDLPIVRRAQRTLELADAEVAAVSGHMAR